MHDSLNVKLEITVLCDRRNYFMPTERSYHKQVQVATFRFSQLYG